MPPIELGQLVDGISLDTKLSYGPTRGSEALRNALAEWYSRIDKENVLITTGTAEANFLVFNALLDKNAEIVVTVPSYMQFHGMAQALGARTKELNLDERNGFRADLEQLNEIVSSKTKVIQFTNPNNPTGNKFSSDEVREICEIAKDAGSYVVFDEAFRGGEQDGIISPSPAGIYEKGVSTGSLTKLGLHGLRIGWVIGEKDLIRKCWAYKDYTTLSHAGISEYLATIALQKDKIVGLVERAREILKAHVAILSKWIDDHGQFFSCVLPECGAAAFPRYEFDIDSCTLCSRLMKEEGVLMVPGDYFRVPKHLRLNCGGYTNTLKDGLNKLDHLVETMARSR